MEALSAEGLPVLGWDESGGRWRVFRERISRGKGAFALEAWPSKPLKRVYNIRWSLNGGRRSKLGRPCTYTVYNKFYNTKEPSTVMRPRVYQRAGPMAIIAQHPPITGTRPPDPGQNALLGIHIYYYSHHHHFHHQPLRRTSKEEQHHKNALASLSSSI